MIPLTFPYLDLGPCFYNTRVYVCFGEDEWRAEPQIAEIGEPFPGGEGCYGTATTFENGEELICISPERHDSFPDLCDTVAHEATHVAQHTFAKINEGTPGIEAEAMLIGSITGFVIEQYILKRNAALAVPGV